MIEVRMALSDSAVREIVGASKRARRRVLAGVGREVRRRWLVLARAEIKSPRVAEVYANAISRPRVDEAAGTVTVELDLSRHVVVRTVEFGARPIDLRRALLASPKAKVSAEGYRYIDVPIEYQDPRMKSARRPFPPELLPAFRRARARERIVPPHAADPLAGLRKDPREYKRVPPHRFQGVKFRRVSEKGESAWLHPGFEAHRLAQRVEAEVPAIAARVLSSLEPV